MYYETSRKKDTMLIIIFMIAVIMLLGILILKMDNKSNQSTTSNYDTSKLSTNNEQTVEFDTSKMINSVVKSVVGISKLQRNGSSIFLNKSEEKLGLGSGIILSDNGYILTNQHVAGNKYGNCYVTL